MSMVGRTTGARPAVRRTSAVGGGPRERDVGGARPVFDDRLGNAASTRTGSRKSKFNKQSSQARSIGGRCILSSSWRALLAWAR